jgi:diguanylate cyclase (GGDEF)-like protein/PAS domain S-box-containing protein
MKFTHVKEISPGQYRRGRLLVALILITSVFVTFLAGINSYYWYSNKSMRDGIYLFVDILGFISLFGTWLINKRGHTYLAGAILIGLYFVRISMIFEPTRFINSFLFFTFPILISSFVIAPVYSFPSAGVSSLLYLFAANHFSIHETAEIVIFKIIFLIMLAGFSFLTSRYLEKVIETLDNSEVKYHSLFNDLPIGLYRTAPDGKIMDINSAFLQMFGFSDAQSAKNCVAADLYADPSSRGKYLSIVEDTTTAEIEMKRQDGKIIWVTDHVTAVRDQAGRVLYYEGSLIDITKRKQAELELESMAITDPLTGLFNRRHFFTQAERIFHQLDSNSTRVAVLMIDLDHFKRINDNYGHMAGDTILREVANRLHGCMRSGDFSCRYGGDEFNLLLNRIIQQDVEAITERFYQTIVSRPILIENNEIFITVSIGVALNDEATSSLDMLLQRADQALYAAKKAGRNGWRIWGSPVKIGHSIEKTSTGV